MQYWIGVLTIVGIYMIAVLGVSILCGFTGMFSMGHAGFMAIGGYVSALLTKNCGVPVFVGVLGGMLVASIVGYLISGDPTYITGYQNARSLICRIDRDELLEELVQFYLSKNV